MCRGFDQTSIVSEAWGFRNQPQERCGDSVVWFVHHMLLTKELGVLEYTKGRTSQSVFRTAIRPDFIPTLIVLLSLIQRYVLDAQLLPEACLADKRDSMKGEKKKKSKKSRFLFRGGFFPPYELTICERFKYINKSLNKGFVLFLSADTAGM